VFCLYKSPGDDARLPHPEEVDIISVDFHLGLAVKARILFQGVGNMSRLKGLRNSAKMFANDF
jgi:hypothetical protein